jgi:transketolase
VADILLSAGLAPTFGKYGITDVVRGQIGSQTWLLDQLGSIEDCAEALL